jgi:hypothetical protein
LTDVGDNPDDDSPQTDIGDEEEFWDVYVHQTEG